MSRPLVVDTFMVNNEFDMLECRLDTMSPAVDYFVAVEADVDHQDHPKPYHITDNLDRFDRWADKLIVVQASGLPHTDHLEDPWAREWAQRDWVWRGLDQIPGVDDDTIVLHGDVDEICEPFWVRNVRPVKREFLMFVQRWYSFAVDWLHPDPWGGTVAVTVETARLIGPRTYVGDELYHPGEWQIVRNQRNGLQHRNFEYLGGNWRTAGVGTTVGQQHAPFTGWHFTWLGGQEAAQRKLGSFCHPEVADRIDQGLSTDLYLREGYHVDGRKMTPVDVTPGAWPDYIVERRCPANWFRPRGES